MGIRVVEDGLVWQGEAKVRNLPNFMDFLEENLTAAGCPRKTGMSIALAAEEIFVNIASYAYKSGNGDVMVRLDFPEGSAQLTFTDKGLPFDPFTKEDPDTTLSAEKRKIGGLGIFMVKKIMDEVSYEYREGQNILRICKKF